MTKDKLPIIRSGTIPNVLLLGNGINRAFEQKSWSELLKGITTIELDEKERVQIDKMPYPLQPIVLTEDLVDEKLDEIATSLMDVNLTEEQGEVLRQIVDLKFDAILTTNYTYEIEKAIEPKFSCKLKANSKYRNFSKKGNKIEEQLGIYKYMKVSKVNTDYRIWHIHGEAARPSSMILGHYYYGKLLSKIQQYISTFMTRYKGCEKHGNGFIPHSWIDYFMLGNVYVVGMGLDFSEMDLWWLINCKKRNMKNQGKIYFYEANLDKEDKLATKMLAETYGMEVITEKVKDNYSSYYKKVISKLMQTRREQEDERKN